jgi:hypothetical protein
MFPRTKITAMFVPDRQECRLSWVYPRKTTRRIRGDTSLDQPRLACQHLRRYRAPIINVATKERVAQWLSAFSICSQTPHTAVLL